MKKNLSIILKIVISVAILYFLFRGMDLASFVETISRVKPISIIAIIALMFFIQVISTLRWQILLKKDSTLPTYNYFLCTLSGCSLIISCRHLSAAIL